MTESHVFDKTLMKSTQWLSEVMNALQISDPRKGLRALRAGLHALRDRLPQDELVQLGAQLPMLLRGLYYEGWSHNAPQSRVRGRDAFLTMVESYLEDPTLDPEAVTRAVVQVLAWHISGGELDDVASTLPRPLAELWSEAFA